RRGKRPGGPPTTGRSRTTVQNRRLSWFILSSRLRRHPFYPISWNVDSQDWSTLCGGILDGGGCCQVVPSSDARHPRKAGRVAKWSVKSLRRRGFRLATSGLTWQSRPPGGKHREPGLGTPRPAVNLTAGRGVAVFPARPTLHQFGDQLAAVHQGHRPAA